MLDAIKKLAAGGKPPSSDDLRAARDGIDVAALEAAVEAAEVGRRDALVGADDRALDRAEQTVAKARRDLDRGRALIEALDERIATAEQAEARAALDAERQAVEVEAAAVAVTLRKEFPGLQRKMVALLNRLAAAEQAVRDVNDKLHAAGRDDEAVAGVEWRARPRPAIQHENAVSLLTNVALPALPELDVGGFGEPIPRTSAFWSAPHRGSDVPEDDRPKPLVAAPAGVTHFPQ